MLLNICGCTSEQFAYAVDVNKNHLGIYLPGSNRKVVSPAFLYEYQPDVVMVLASGYLQSIMEKNKKCVLNDGKFIRMIPQVKFVNG